MKELVVNSAVDCWIKFLTNTITDSEQDDSLSEKFTLILKSILVLLMCHSVSALPAKLLQELTWIITLPWLANDFSWKDLKPLKPKVVTNISSSMVGKLDDLTVSCCLVAMAMIPKDTATSWRTHVITQVMNDNNETLLRTAVKCFPVMVHNLGTNSGYLMKQLYLPLLDQQNVLTLREVADRFGETLLAKANISQVDKTDLVGVHPGQVGLRVSVLESHSDKVLKVEDVHPLFKLLKHQDKDVRQSAVSSLAKVLNFVEIGGADSVKQKVVTSCLNPLEDDVEQIRIKCCSFIPCLVSHNARNPIGKPAAIDTLILQHLEQICSQVHSKKKRGQLESAIKAFGQFGKLVDGQLLKTVVVRLFEYRLSQPQPVSNVAFTQLEQIAESRKESLHQIYVRFKHAICKFLVEKMYFDQVNSRGANVKSTLVNLMRTLELDDMKSFLQGNEKFMLPFLVSKASAESTKLLKMIADLQCPGSNRRPMLMNNIHYIYSYLVCFCSTEDMERAFVYLQTETEFSLGNLLRLHFQRVHNELFLYLSTHYQQVFEGLKVLASHDQMYKGGGGEMNSEQMSLYLEPRLLGILAFFDAQLMNSNVTMEDKELVLRSVIFIIQLMGPKHITTIRHKVMNTLRLGLQFSHKTIVEVSCKAWNCFVRSLELPLLGLMMSHIIATLLPLLQCLPAKVADIFNYMIVDNRKTLSKHFHEIYFLPDIPELADAMAVVKQYGDSFDNGQNLKLILAHAIKGIQHESHDVREHALSKLRKTLADKQSEISNYLLNNEQAEPVMSQLVAALLNGCRDANIQTQILYGQCLGELGAIDPGRLEMITNKPSVKQTDFHSSMDDDRFAFTLINIVVKTFLAVTEPNVQDCAALSLQELLQIYGCSESGETQVNQGVNPHSKLWKMFPEQTQEILTPLLSSKYRLSIDADYKLYPKPLYGSEKGKNFKDWISNWTGYLISSVRPGKPKQVLTACSAIKRHNMEVARHVLPHTVLQILLAGNQVHIKEMFDELMEVLTYMQKPEMRLESASNFHHLSAQTVFSILDFLTRWSVERGLALTDNRGLASCEKDGQYMAVRKFLERIPQEVFAMACFNCKAYTRALRHFEMFINTTSDIQPHLDFMQRLYVSMEEPDGVLGVAAVRMSQPTPMQQILMYESLGEFLNVLFLLF